VLRQIGICRHGGRTWDVAAGKPFLGYPRAITTFQSRIGYFGNRAAPDTGWFTESSNFDRLLRTKLDQWGSSELQSGNAAAFEVTLASGQADQIQWAVDAGKGDLAIGTLGAEWIAFAPDTASGFGPTNLKFERHSSYGSDHVQAIMVGDTPVFVQKGGKAIRTLEFRESSGKYLSVNINQLADHILRDGYVNRTSEWDYSGVSLTQYNVFVELVYDKQFECLWARSSFGDAFCCRYNRADGVAAWSKIYLGGTYNSTEPTKVQSIAAVPQRLDPATPVPSDLLYFAATRDFDSGIGTFLEYIGEEFDRPSLDISAAGAASVGTSAKPRFPLFLDFAIAFKNTSSSTVEQLPDTFAGTSFSFLANGKTQGSVSVIDNGDGFTRFNWDQEYILATTGFKYTHKLKTTRIEQGSQIGSAQGLIQRIHEVTVRLFRSAQLKVGDPDETTKMEEVTFDKIDDNSSNPIALFTGDKEVDMPSAYDTDPYVYIEGDEPLPLNIAAIIAKGEVYEG
jgi:hypothetical protein